MFKQFWCWLWRGHEKRALDNTLRYYQRDYPWTCIKCNKTGSDNICPPKKYNEHETTKPKLNIIKFKDKND
jgi:hypothetical protein